MIFRKRRAYHMINIEITEVYVGQIIHTGGWQEIKEFTIALIEGTIKERDKGEWKSS